MLVCLYVMLMCAVLTRVSWPSSCLCSIQQRASILQQLLQDRDASVAEAGRSMLAHWLDQHCGADPLQLLQHLDVETYTGGYARRCHTQRTD